MNQQPDPSTREILDKIDQDIELCPDALRPVDRDLLRQARELTDGVEPDLDAELDQ